MSKLNPRQAGGIEPVEPKPFASTSALDNGTLSDLDPATSDEEDDGDEAMPAATEAVAPVVEKKLAKGEGRIIRDASGKIVRIVMGGEGSDGEDVVEDVKERVAGESDSDDDDESDEEAAPAPPKKSAAKPWGEAMEVWDGEGSDEGELEEDDVSEYLRPRKVGQGIAVGAKRRRIVAKTDVVKGAYRARSPSLTLAELEHLATLTTKVIRHTSTIEADWLVALVAKYGDDVDKMARDRKANVWQKTAGEIKRACVVPSPVPRLTSSPG